MRLAKFNLKFAEQKTKIIAFGRYAEKVCKRNGKDKPDTFDFLGFTHYYSKSRQGRFRVKRKTSGKKFKAKVKEFKQWIKEARYLPMKIIIDTARVKLIGHLRYYGITDNSKMISSYRHNVIKLLYEWVNRRSQRKSFSYKKFKKYLKTHPLPMAKIYVNIYA